MRIQLLFAIIVLCLSLSACTKKQVDTHTEAQKPRQNTDVVLSAAEKKEPPMQNQPTKSAPLKIQGQIHYVNIEGGFWALITANGEKYTFTNLDEQYKRQGLIVSVEVIEINDRMSTTQFGKLVEIQSIMFIKDAKIKDMDKDL